MNEQYDTVKQGKLKLKESEPFFLVIFSLLTILNTATLSIYTKIETSVDAAIFDEFFTLKLKTDETLMH